MSEKEDVTDEVLIPPLKKKEVERYIKCEECGNVWVIPYGVIYDECSNCGSYKYNIVGQAIYNKFLASVSKETTDFKLEDVGIIPVKKEFVDHPDHYNKGSIEVIDFIEDWEFNFNRGSAIKYICRAGIKDPNKEMEDLEKVIWYIQREIELIRKG